MSRLSRTSSDTSRSNYSPSHKQLLTRAAGMLLSKAEARRIAVNCCTLSTRLRRDCQIYLNKKRAERLRTTLSVATRRTDI
jgi:hypothetical protein